MNRPAPHTVLVVTPGSLALLDAHLGKRGMPAMHEDRFQVQRDGAGLYLAAWRDGIPVGHVLLHFRRPPHHGSLARHADCAYVEALEVRAQDHRRGVALALMQSAEAYARADGAPGLGLSVGVDSAPARSLYRKLGYQPSELPDYEVSWIYRHPETGEPTTEGELCSFWLKVFT